MTSSAGSAVPFLNTVTGESLGMVSLTGMETTEQLLEMCTNSRLDERTILFLDGQMCQARQTLAAAGFCDRSSISMLKSKVHLVLTASSDCTARVWDHSGKCVLTLQNHDPVVEFARFSPDGHRIATVSSNEWGDPSRVEIWDSSTGVCLWEMITSAVLADPKMVCFSPDSRHIAIAGAAKVGRNGRTKPLLWSMETGDPLSTDDKLCGELIQSWSVDFSPDGQRVVVCSRTVDVWSNSGELICSLDHPPAPPHEHHASFSQDGLRILLDGCCIRESVMYATASVFDASSGERLLTFERIADGFSNFSPHGLSIVVPTHGHTAQVWSAWSGECLLTLEGHQAAVLSACFSADCRYIVTCSEDFTAKVWNAEGGECILTLEGHTEPINSASFWCRFQMDEKGVAM